MANLTPHNLVFDRFATDDEFRKRLWIAFNIWVRFKIGDSATPTQYLPNFIDLMGKIIIAPIDINSEMNQKLQRVASAEAAFWDTAITDTQIFEAFEFCVFPLLFAFGYVDSPSGP